MPCATGSLNCTTSNSSDRFGVLSGYSAGTGYDLATGLGSVNANNLVNDWGSVKFTPSTTALTLNGNKSINITHGAPISVSISVSPSSPQPTGDVSLIATQGTNSFGIGTLTLSNGVASGTNSMLPGGTSYAVSAHYEGDGTYGGSNSNSVTVTVTPESSKTGLRVVTFDPFTGQITNPNATTFPYGSFYFLRSDVTNSSATNCFNSSSKTLTYACPTGSVAFTDNSNPLGSGAFALNSQGYTEDQVLFENPTAQLAGGSHNLDAAYAGDNSYNSSSATDAVTVTPAPTATLALFNPPLTTVTIGTPIDIQGQTTSQSLGTAPTGNYIAFDGTTQLGTNSVLGFAGSPQRGASCQGGVFISLTAPSGPHTLFLAYSGDTNYTGSKSVGITVNAIYGTTTVATANPTNIIFGNSVTVTATVSTGNPSSNSALKPTGTVSFNGSSGGPITNPVTTSVSTDSSGNWIIQATVTTTPQQTETISGTYSGDSNYATSTGYAPTVIVTIPDFTISASSMPLAIPAGQAGNSTITITPLSSNTSTVTLSCGSVVIPGATCSISPTSVTLTNNTAATATLTMTTLPPSSSLSAVTTPSRLHGSGLILLMRPALWSLSVLAGLASLLLLVLPRSQRSFRAVLGLGLVSLLSFALGCGGGSSESPPVSTTTMLSTSSVKTAQGTFVTLTATVSSTKPVSGNVTFSSSNCGYSNVLGLIGGTVQTQTNPLLAPGTCIFLAQYAGDAHNQPSQSGNLNIAVTGNTQQQIMAQTSTLSHGISVNITIQ
jgi:hypothetical protein